MDNIVDVYRNATSQLQKVVEQTPQRIKQLHSVVQRTDLEEQDLLHLAEFETFNAAEGYYITQQIKKVRQKRRKAKEEIEALNSIRVLMNNNSKFDVHVNGLCKSIGIRSETTKTYKVRVRTDLIKRFERIEQRTEVK